MMNYEELKKVVNSILDDKTSLKKEGEIYRGDIYVDHYDKLSERQVKNIINSNDMMSAFYDEMFDFEIQCQDYEFDYIFSVVKDNWDSEAYGDYEEHYDEISEYLREAVEFDFPHDQYLKTEVLLDIIVDNGDGDHDFTLNNFLSYNANRNLEIEDRIEDESSILWLVEQQGYTKEDLCKAIESEEEVENKFLYSVIRECENVTSHMNALAFFIKMSLGQYIEYLDNNDPIVLPSNVSCGLYDCWMGAGGLLEIQLAKPVIIPRDMAQIHVDGDRGYSVYEIYGISDDFWTEIA